LNKYYITNYTTYIVPYVIIYEYYYICCPGVSFITVLQYPLCPVASLWMRGKCELHYVGPPPSHNPSVRSTSPLTDDHPSGCDGRGWAGTLSAWKTQRPKTNPYQKPAWPHVDITRRPGLRNCRGFNAYKPAFCLCLCHEVLNQLESGSAAFINDY